MRRGACLLGLLVGCAGETRPAPQLAAPITVDARPAAVVIDAAVPVDAAPPAPAPHLELTFAGDIQFGGVFRGRFRAANTAALDPFAAMRDALASDLALANLETTVQATIPVDESGDKRFAATPDQLALVATSGLDVVTLANNHAWDYGAAAVRETQRYVAAAGLRAVGVAYDDEPAWRVETVEVRGWRVGIIAGTTKTNRGVAAGDPRLPIAEPGELVEVVTPLVQAARADHDLVIVTVHWGTQYAEAPDAWQVTAAHAFVDAGADLVIGHHPHVLQGFERYQGGLIAYSLGNFVFRNAQLPARHTGVLRVGFARQPAGRACLDGAALQPAIMIKEPTHHPMPATGSELAALAKRVTRISAARPLRTAVTLDGGVLRLPAACAAIVGADVPAR